MADEETLQNQASDGGSEKKSKKGLLKFILIPVVLAAQAVGAYYVVFNVLLEHPSQAIQPQKSKPNLEVGQFFEINDIVVNPLGSAGRRYLVVEMGLETTTPEVIQEAESKEIWIRDAIITLLTNKTAEELLDLSIRKDLKKEILTALNRKLSKGKFERLYFKRYIIQ